MGTKEIQITAETGRVGTLFMPTHRLTEDSVRAGDGEKIIIELLAYIDTNEEAVMLVVEQSGKIIAVEIGGYDLRPEPKAVCRYSLSAIFIYSRRKNRF